MLVKFLLLLCLFVSGCAQRIIDFTMISTKNFDISKKHVRGKERVKGKDGIPIIIFIPCGSPDIKEAIDEAIEKTPGCVALADGVLYSKFWYIPYIYGQSWYEVEGTPVLLVDEKLEMENTSKQSKKIEAKDSVVKPIQEEKTSPVLQPPVNTTETKRSGNDNQDSWKEKLIITNEDGHLKIIQKE